MLKPKIFEIFLSDYIIRIFHLKLIFPKIFLFIPLFLPSLSLSQSLYLSPFHSRLTAPPPSTVLSSAPTERHLTSTDSIDPPYSPVQTRTSLAETPHLFIFWHKAQNSPPLSPWPPCKVSPNLQCHDKKHHHLLTVFSCL